MSTLGDRIKEAAAEVGGLNKLAVGVGIPRRTVGHWLEGKQPKPSALEAVAKFTGVNLAWLVSGEGDRKPVDRDQSADEAASFASEARRSLDHPASPTIKFVPLKVSAGGGAAVLYESQGIDLDMDGLADTILRSRRKNISLFEIKGDSMLPTLAHGDFVVVDKSQPRPGDEPEDDKIYLISIENDLYAKRSSWLENGEQQWRSDNDLPEYAPIPVRGEDFNRVKIIGRVIWAWKPV